MNRKRGFSDISFLLIAIDVDDTSADTLERLRNITKMFSGKDDEQQELHKVEKFAPSEKIKRTFRK
jgi:hypothetical protein